MFKIEKKVFSDEMYFDGMLLLKYTIEYPQIICNKKIDGIRNFNLYNYNKALELRKKSEEELFKDSIETYKYDKENGYPVRMFEVYSTFNITYNEKECVSLYIDDYLYTGGAHGNTIRSSQTWNIEEGRKLSLKEFYPYNSEYILDILKNIIKQIREYIKNGNNIYFDDYCSLVLETFNTDNFYLEENYIVIYFQQYNIGPYSSGIVTFKIRR